MEEIGKIHRTIQTYLKLTGPHERYRSWENCFQYFHSKPPEAIGEDRNHAALQLGFYLASWGMYRGSSFLPNYAHTIHLGVIDQLIAPQFSALWGQEFGASDNDPKLPEIIIDAFKAVREAYKPFAPENRQASDTLITKVLLGIFACLPACDKFFLSGFKSTGKKYSAVDISFVNQILVFGRDNFQELREEQRDIKTSSGVFYPLMKLVDMYFWQIGKCLAAPR